MTNSSLRKNGFIGLLSLFVVVAVLGCGTMVSNAVAPTTNISITNNSGRSISHIYLSPPNSDNWGPDQLNDNAVASGSSVTISSAACEGSVKVIAEDQDGCFISTTIACSENAGWTISSDAPRNCGN